MDDQNQFLRFLGTEAKSGEQKLILTSKGYIHMFYKGCWIKIADDKNSEIRRIKSVDRTKITLKATLQHSYKKGATVTGVKTQSWGILATGDKCRDNSISNNVCKGNLKGGILYQGKSNVLNGNVGRISEIKKR